MGINCILVIYNHFINGLLTYENAASLDVPYLSGTAPLLGEVQNLSTEDQMSATNLQLSCDPGLKNKNKYSNNNVCVCVYICIYVCVYMYICIYVCVCVCVCVF